jgi:hypothetical protein
MQGSKLLETWKRTYELQREVDPPVQNKNKSENEARNEIRISTKPIFLLSL